MGDIIILTIIAISVYTGFKRGFVRAALGAASSIVAGVAGFALCTPIGKIAAQSAMGKAIREKVISSFSENPAQPLSSLAAESAADITVNIVCFIISAVLIKLAVSAAARILCGVARLPIIKQADGALGAFAGFFGGVIICYILIGLSAALPQNSAYSAIFSAIDKSYLSALFYNTNFLTDAISGIREGN